MPRFAMESDISVLDSTDVIFVKKIEAQKLGKVFNS